MLHLQETETPCSPRSPRCSSGCPGHSVARVQDFLFMNGSLPLMSSQRAGGVSVRTWIYLILAVSRCAEHVFCWIPSWRLVSVLSYKPCTSFSSCMSFPAVLLSRVPHCPEAKTNRSDCNLYIYAHLLVSLSVVGGLSRTHRKSVATSATTAQAEASPRRLSPSESTSRGQFPSSEHRYFLCSCSRQARGRRRCARSMSPAPMG